MNPEDRFNIKIDEMKFISSDGEQVESSKLSEFLKQRKQKMLTITEKVGVGDVVRVKHMQGDLTVQKVNGEYSDYEGSLPTNSARWYLFNQEDIAEVISKVNEQNPRHIR